jgi:hypothetical protein
LVNIPYFRKISILLAVSAAAIMAAVPGLSLAPTSVVYAQSSGGGGEDKDGDGVPNSSDRCPNTSNPRCFKEDTTTTPKTTQAPGAEGADWCYGRHVSGTNVQYMCYPTKAECDQEYDADPDGFQPCNNAVRAGS